MSDFSILIPFCIYHWFDKQHFIYKSYIAPAIRKYNPKNNPENKYNYDCIHSDVLYNNGWKLATVFFAVNPSYKPIPVGMKLFRVQRTQSFPYDVVDVHLKYDVYNIDKNDVYFITYTKPVPNTIPLYIWKKNGSTFIDYASTSPPVEKDSPFTTLSHSTDISQILTEKGWGSALINPIYIIHPNIVGWDIDNIKFQCNNGVCIPVSLKNNPQDIFNPNKFKEPKVLHECIVSCSQLVNNNYDEPARNLISIIKKSDIDTPAKKPILYIIIIIIFIILVGFLIYRGR